LRQHARNSRARPVAYCFACVFSRECASTPSPRRFASSSLARKTNSSKARSTPAPADRSPPSSIPDSPSSFSLGRTSLHAARSRQVAGPLLPFTAHEAQSLIEQSGLRIAHGCFGSSARRRIFIPHDAIRVYTPAPVERGAILVDISTQSTCAPPWQTRNAHSASITSPRLIPG
jgi:hypothetical protein